MIDDFSNFPFVNTWDVKLILKILNVVVNWIVSIVSNIGILKKIPEMLLTELFLFSQHWVFFNQIISSFQKL